MRSNIFLEAIELLKNSNEVRVFAPTGCWCQTDGKDAWLLALARSGKRTYFAYGDAPDNDSEKQKIVNGRIALLKTGNVELIKFPHKDTAHMGFIIFDTCALCGIGKDNEYKLITNEYEMLLLMAGFEAIYARERFKDTI
jgi:hypothetical protein